MANDWSATALCTPADCLALEKNALKWSEKHGGPQQWIDQAKAEIELALRVKFRQEELDTDAADVLDLVFNVDKLTIPAAHLTLANMLNDLSTDAGRDHLSAKAAYHMDKHKSTMRLAMELLHFDLDESGTIEESEKYHVKKGVTLGRY